MLRKRIVSMGQAGLVGGLPTRTVSAPSPDGTLSFSGRADRHGTGPVAVSIAASNGASFDDGCCKSMPDKLARLLQNMNAGGWDRRVVQRGPASQGVGAVSGLRRKIVDSSTTGADGMQGGGGLRIPSETDWIRETEGE